MCRQVCVCVCEADFLISYQCRIVFGSVRFNQNECDVHVHIFQFSCSHIRSTKIINKNEKQERKNLHDPILFQVLVISLVPCPPPCAVIQYFQKKKKKTDIPIQHKYRAYRIRKYWLLLKSYRLCLHTEFVPLVLAVSQASAHWNWKIKRKNPESVVDLRLRRQTTPTNTDYVPTTNRMLWTNEEEPSTEQQPKRKRRRKKKQPMNTQEYI